MSMLVMRTGLIHLFLTMVLLYFPLLAKAQVVDSELPGVTILDAESLIELAHENPELIVIDSRVRDDRELGYIEDSLSLPDERTSCRSLEKITTNKSRLLAFYCNGVNCERSLKAIKIARQCQYQHLFWFRGGFQEWRLKDYPYLME